ncbi:interleukin-13 receptor subunit alpha-2-like isoform X2 [Hypomesus transpacificus]|uniref:interleukin-13 receptor subunit alpha-2-like isoform X2 n=1 Tax=Hypomesus transpacificus TaxID=137520 RepID=UPI001F088649|nr:interleukin-13 receptor subunit alpha-2-like isoform X2 [Hypomesus transpacificus]
MLFQYFGIIAILLCFTLVSESGTDKVPLPAPSHLSINWRDKFCLTLSWQAPQEDLGDCKVTYVIQNDELKNSIKRPKREYKVCHFTEKTVKYTVQTEPIECGDRNLSEPVTQIIPQHTVLQHIKDFNCYLYSTKDMNCSWLTSNHVSDLQLFYRGDMSMDAHLAACTEYMYRNGVKTGCHLHDNQDFVSRTLNDVYFLLNGTFDGSPFQNTFKRTPSNLVKPPPPKLNIKQEGKKLVLEWEPPDIFEPHCWEYRLNYSKCGETSSVTSQTNSASISYDSVCQYKIQLETIFKSTCGEGSIVRGPFEVYGQDNHKMIVVAIIVPIIIFVSVIIALVCLRRHKTIIFPEIPKPQLIFKDIMNNNKEPKNPIEKLYVPIPEEVYIPVPENVK